MHPSLINFFLQSFLTLTFLDESFLWRSLKRSKTKLSVAGSVTAFDDNVQLKTLCFRANYKSNFISTA